MIFNTNKNVDIKRAESLSYYMYTSDRKYNDLSKTLHSNFCKTSNNTTLLNNSLKFTKSKTLKKNSPKDFKKSSS